MHERLLQFIWANLYFRREHLLTTDRQPLVILNQGRVNGGDGPDFLQASIELDGLIFHGDIEIHITAKGWYDHRHNEDSRYNKVILHVVLDDKDLTEARRTDDTLIPTLVLRPYVNENVTTLFRNSRKRTTLACAGFLKDTGHNLIVRQWTKASDLYFNYKVEALHKTYNTALPPSEAWRHLLTEALFDGLGISHNRSAMRRLFKILLEAVPSPTIYPFRDILTRGFTFAGLNKESNPGYLARNDWSFSNTRPANQPAIRIPQAIAMWYIIWQLPLTAMLKEPIPVSWSLITAIDTMTKNIGEERKNILYATVFIPAIHILGSLFHDNELQQRAFAAWKEVSLKVPGSILAAFRRSGLDDDIIKDNPATVYQFKHLCKSGRCNECEIMKMILKP